jgi:type IV pilus assembly protein PilQ
MAHSLGRCFSIAAFLLLLGTVGTPPVQTLARVSLEVRNADVREILRMLTQAGGLNVVIGPDVTGTLTLRLHDVPVDEALQIVLNTTGLVQVREGTTVGILSREAWLRQQQQQVELHTLGMASMRTAIVPHRYAKATELAPLLATLLSPRHDCRR